MPHLGTPITEQAEQVIGDYDDPSNEWWFGDKGELFEYKLVGVHSTQSGALARTAGCAPTCSPACMGTSDRATWGAGPTTHLLPRLETCPTLARWGADRRWNQASAARSGGAILRTYWMVTQRVSQTGKPSGVGWTRAALSSQGVSTPNTSRGKVWALPWQDARWGFSLRWGWGPRVRTSWPARPQMWHCAAGPMTASMEGAIAAQPASLSGAPHGIPGFTPSLHATASNSRHCPCHAVGGCHFCGLAGSWTPQRLQSTSWSRGQRALSRACWCPPRRWATLTEGTQGACCVYVQKRVCARV
jgi:hypothetical protein